jgi:hypothetical protein
MGFSPGVTAVFFMRSLFATVTAPYRCVLSSLSLCCVLLFANHASGQSAEATSTESIPEEKAQDAAHLHRLLENHHLQLQDSAPTQPIGDEAASREAVQRDAEALAKIPFSAEKVRLTGSEGSKVLLEISQRLTNPLIPQSRRDIAPICLVKTRLFDTLVTSESRSLQPIGKDHYITRVRLQPGDTTISILSNHWEVQLPEQANARDYFITLYRPIDGTPELHVFAVDDLLAADEPHIPAWLPDDQDSKTQEG